MAKNVLLICGGGGSEHDISLRSAKYLQEKLNSVADLEVYFVEIGKDQTRRDSKGRACELRKDGLLVLEDQTIKLDFAIPCIHGPPGESGHIQAVFEMMGLPFLGCGHEASILCFNKISTKLWLQALHIPVTPFVFLSDFNDESLQEVKNFFEIHKDVFIKASEQGSSVGCYHVTEKSQLETRLKEAFALSPFVLVEKTIKGRELEIATYQYNGQLFATNPGEIVCPDKFYTFEEKYNSESKTETKTEAQGLSSVIKEEMKSYAKRAFAGLRLKDLSRIDFFLDHEGSVYLNEINTFPGHTAISLFPLMMENNGLKYQDFLTDRIHSYLKA
ncbi:MAG: D-alanine--D-alanine ligase [Bdellovibrio sp. CG12_big_fil_rev_8_21_14_0_65_39_13]|nr:MAG: D-alanine--D-alanine ligase [Bdellovibrio sp. CG22_combo_CG10-13_8_21_14_all_39_27]PIQ57605.1 MAG: D-alanine--D-alanine ligase [Bdellovibrio sp. CG12_big_fil_rev_8_21_14_0_65_39_13]PIR35769.1 MAG: D-alanine--D-alanine ligase [Bdellovibrio sp. CG11_big_fil_rev_8_21_14_0_20_39_38]